MRLSFFGLSAAVLAALAGTTGTTGAAPALTEGKPAIEAFGTLAFAPDGVLLVGDSASGAVWAVDLGDRTPTKLTAPVSVEALDRKLGALLGTTADQILVHDLAVNPISKNIYVSVSRSLRKANRRWLAPNTVDYPKALVRVTPSGALEVVSLAKVRYARAALPDVPAAPPPGSDKNDRAYAISDLHYADGKVYVAGMSNQEFTSTFRIFDYPFGATPSPTTSVEIFHGAHGKYETDAPIQTFAPLVLRGKPHLLAGYTCTPLVAIPTAELRAGKHIRGTTLAETGDGNSPTDIVTYQINGKWRVAMANSKRAVMVFDAAELERALVAPITKPVEDDHGTAGARFHSPPIAAVQQLDVLDDKYAVLVLRSHVTGELDLQSVELTRL